MVFGFKKTLISFAFATSLLGCATSPPTHFYTLSNVSSSPATISNQVDAKSIKIQIGAISIPEVVDRPQLVISNPDHRVDILYQERWSQPLRNEISAAVISNLQQLIPGAVITDSRIKTIDADYRISLDVRKFETTPRATSVAILWKIEGLKNSKTISQESQATENVEGGGYEQAVAAHSQALQKVSKELAKSIKEIY